MSVLLRSRPHPFCLLSCLVQKQPDKILLALAGDLRRLAHAGVAVGMGDHRLLDFKQAQIHCPLCRHVEVRPLAADEIALDMMEYESGTPGYDDAPAELDTAFAKVAGSILLESAKLSRALRLPQIGKAFCVSDWTRG